jgi:hypothetical protein
VSRKQPEGKKQRDKGLGIRIDFRDDSTREIPRANPPQFELNSEFIATVRLMIARSLKGFQERNQLTLFFGREIQSEWMPEHRAGFQPGSP